MPSGSLVADNVHLAPKGCRLTAWAAAAAGRPTLVLPLAEHHQPVQASCGSGSGFCCNWVFDWGWDLLPIEANGACERGVRGCRGLQELLWRLLTLQVAARHQHSAMEVDQPSAPLRQCRAAACQQRMRIAWDASLLTRGMYALENAQSSLTHQLSPQMAGLMGIS